MAEPAKQLQLIDNEDTQKKLKSKIFETHTEELVIGLCGPIGTDINFVSKRLEQILSDTFDYKCVFIKLSDLIVMHGKVDTNSNYSGFDRYNKLINAGNG